MTLKHLLLSIFLLAMIACKADEQQRDTSPEPKTSFGQAVKKGKDLSKIGDLRNKEIDKQAKYLSEE